MGIGDRAALAELADCLIPAGRGFPSASAAGVASSGLDNVLAARPDVEAALLGVLRAADGQAPQDFLRSLRTADPHGFDVLTYVVAGGYFSIDDVARTLAYQGRTAQPLHELDAGPAWEGDLLQSVRGRGQIYRATPPTAGAT